MRFLILILNHLQRLGRMHFENLLQSRVKKVDQNNAKYIFMPRKLQKCILSRYKQELRCKILISSVQPMQKMNGERFSMKSSRHALAAGFFFFNRQNHLLFYVKTCWIMISCFIFYSPFCLMNLLQKIPLQFDEEQGLWILRRELAVSVSHHALHLCLFGSKFLSLQNCCAFNTWKKKKKLLYHLSFLLGTNAEIIQ